MARYSLFVLKLPLNTNQPTQGLNKCSSASKVVYRLSSNDCDNNCGNCCRKLCLNGFSIKSVAAVVAGHQWGLPCIFMSNVTEEKCGRFHLLFVVNSLF